MADMTVDEFLKKLEQVMPAFEQDFLERCANRTPVSQSGKGNTGRLQRGWSWEGSKDARYFINEAPYAIYVEMGTIHMAPRMMVRLTALEGTDILKQAIAKAGL